VLCHAVGYSLKHSDTARV